MHAGNGCSRTVKEFVIALGDWFTVQRQRSRNRLLMASPLRRRRRPALWSNGTLVLAALGASLVSNDARGGPVVRGGVPRADLGPGDLCEVIARSPEHQP